MNMFPILARTRIVTVGCVLGTAILAPWSLTLSSVTAQESAGKKFSPEVVKKAEKILEEAGLRRNGKLIQATDTADVARALNALTREKRELRLIYREWKTSGERVAALQNELRKLNAQDVELNLQLARVPDNDVRANNRIVGMLNVSRARVAALVGERELLKKAQSLKRAALNQAESHYAGTVLTIRKGYVVTRNAVEESLRAKDVQIALGVMHTNFGAPKTPTADTVLRTLDQRIAKIEEQIFSETIKMEVIQGAMFVDVVVGKKTTRMVVDSGASMITLPSKTAADLGVTVPVDARELKLVLADGSEIPARGVVLPRVRIGQFEAQNVQAAVLDPTAINAEPLLGMSFLGNFKFEIDPTEKSLKLLRVETD